MPSSVAGSGPVTDRTIPAPLRISARLPSTAPAASKSPSPTDAPLPAPRSTATSAPSAIYFFTISGIAAQRVSAAPSFRTAIFMGSSLPIGLDDDQRDDPDDQTDDGPPFEQLGEALIIVDVRGHLVRARVSQD